jgi:prevent-host-death family protein
MATGDGVRRCTPTARRQYAGSTRSFRPEPRELSLGEAGASMIDGVMPVSHGETYSCPMSTTVSMSKARSTLPHLVDQARHDTVFLTKRGHTVGVLLSPDAYERMLKALDDADDVAAHVDPGTRSR